MATPFSRVFWEDLSREAWVNLGNEAPSPADKNFDAFRHAYTSALWSFNFGERIAREGGDYIERSNPRNFNGSEYMSRDMRGDLLNNAIGRRIGEEHPGGNQPSLAERVRDALNRGDLVIDKQNDPRTLKENFPSDLWPARTLDGERDTRSIWEIEGLPTDPLVRTIEYVPVDPLVLDLDGDGLEITGLSQRVLFDGDADGIKTNSAWVGRDDALLVWDRNGNGLIDSGRELFGDETVLANGQKAAHGFAALSELDGNGDGRFDASDAAYTQVRLWRDLNQDGVSQANELFSLSDLGVKSINLNSTGTRTRIGDSTLVQRGSFERADGSIGEAGSFLFDQNQMLREFTPMEVSEAARALPNFKASGLVRDLGEVKVPY